LSSSVTETNASTVFFAEIQPQVDLDASGANRPVTDCGFRGEVADRGVSITTALATESLAGCSPRPIAMLLPTPSFCHFRRISSSYTPAARVGAKVSAL
jgi:hypothetical protein